MVPQRGTQGDPGLRRLQIKHDRVEMLRPRDGQRHRALGIPGKADRKAAHRLEGKCQRRAEGSVVIDNQDLAGAGHRFRLLFWPVRAWACVGRASGKARHGAVIQIT